MAAGEQGSIPRFVMLETWPRETVAIVFVQFIVLVLSTCNNLPLAY